MSGGKYGGQAPLAVVGRGLTASSVIDFQDDLDHWCVTLAPVTDLQGNPVIFPAGISGQFTCNVQWGHGGIPQFAQLDWPVRGGTFEVQGSSMIVFGSLDPFSAIIVSGGLINIVPEIQFRAHAAPNRGPRAAGSGSEPTRTIEFGDIAIGATTILFRVPAYASRYWFQCANAPGSGWSATVEFLTPVPVPFVTRADDWTQFTIFSPMFPPRVPPEDTWVRITNTTTGPPALLSRVRLVFPLDLG